MTHRSVIPIQEFSGTLEVFGKLDPVINEHFDRVSAKPGCLSYFSLDIQGELNNLLAARVRRTIISPIQASCCSVLFVIAPVNVHIE
jgi:hypothetical protein